MDEEKSPITLKKLEQSDSKTLFEWRSHPIVWKNFTDKKPPTEGNHLKWIAENIENETKVVYIAKTDRTPVGVVKFYDFCTKKKTASWSFYLDPSLKGRGIGALIEFRALDEYFYALSQKTLRCVVFSENHTVINLHKRFGFVSDNYGKLVHIPLDKSVEVVHLKLTSQRWMSARPEVKERLSKAVKKIYSINSII